MTGYRPDTAGIIYYLSGTYQGQEAVKIGISSSPNQRARQLRSELLAWHEGTRQTEIDLHTRFANDRLGGEWFAPTPVLLAHIANVQEQSPERTVNDLFIAKTFRMDVTRLQRDRRDGQGGRA